MLYSVDSSYGVASLAASLVWLMAAYTWAAADAPCCLRARLAADAPCLEAHAPTGTSNVLCHR